VFQELIIPNAFSPNGDGINDLWKVRGLETYPDAVVSIFNRYGQPLFKQKSSSKGWDGKRNGQSLPIGTYYYMIELNNGYAPVSGSILLIR
jgi:gliding motility-associated-like protein